MDCKKVGKLILNLRKEKNMTQKELADILLLSDRTISKWERGMGCPDVSLLKRLSEILEVDIEKILDGDLDPNDYEGGNMKKTQFYVCPTCGNVLTSIGQADISCCGRKLTMLAKEASKDAHAMHIEEVDNEYYITFEHEMEKTHYISFVAYVGYDRVLIVKLYPEQNAEVRLPRMQGKRIVAYCSQHGLWEERI